MYVTKRQQTVLCSMLTSPIIKADMGIHKGLWFNPEVLAVGAVSSSTLLALADRGWVAFITLASKHNVAEGQTFKFAQQKQAFAYLTPYGQLLAESLQG